MQSIRPNGDEFLNHGTEADLKEYAQKETEAFPGTKQKMFKEGETIVTKNGTRMKVTKHGLQVDPAIKKKANNRKRNKAAKKARRKARR